MKALFVTLGALILLAACASDPTPRGPAPGLEKDRPPVPPGEGEEPMSFPKSVEDYLGEELISFLPRLERVESYRIEPRRAPEGPGLLAGHPIVSQGRHLTPEEVKTLSQWLLDPQSYLFATAKKMPFLPSIALKAFAGERFVVVLFMPEGVMLALPHEGRSWIEDYDPVKPKVDALLGTLF